MAGRPAQRQGDANEAGGLIKLGVPSVRINGLPAATLGSPVSPHLPCPLGTSHCNAKTSIGARTVRVNGKPLILTGNKDTCDHARVGGSPDVRAV
jgi:uncharacterized Zn-binding protein involved in type VI secretion